MPGAAAIVRTLSLATLVVEAFPARDGQPVTLPAVVAARIEVIPKVSASVHAVTGIHACIFPVTTARASGAASQGQKQRG